MYSQLLNIVYLSILSITAAARDASSPESTNGMTRRSAGTIFVCICPLPSRSEHSSNLSIDSSEDSLLQSRWRGAARTGNGFAIV